MHLEYLLYIISIILYILFTIKAFNLRKSMQRIKTLEKRLKGNLTDYEKLVFIIELYNSIDSNKLRPDQKELWENWVFENFGELEESSPFKPKKK